MRMLMDIQFPTRDFNPVVRDGTAAAKLRQILEDLNPEAAYFTEHNGERGAVVVVNVNEAADLPKFAEPWFLAFNASVEFRIAMTPQDLQAAGVGELGKRWA